ncbi:MAG: DUF488 domain-containing protein [Planctomycetes bacterium]|nr:DUF488 domain-containing protein [Planctomycetota bacterium]MBU4398970.1 DUF488 domain-containing protein [Planctomycetota bacterium]MCG2685068.1 DUF488 domain-containing protein [Planctomycetales bacterium]
MPSASSSPAGTLWTIGHSNHPLDVFLDLLTRHRIEVLADVRSSPYSRYASQFNRETIRPALRGRAIEYRFLGDRLGGRVDDPTCCDDAGHVLYGRMAESPGFRQAIEQLLDEAGQARVAILCGEEDPTDCHRRLLVGRVAQQHRACVMHIRGDGRIQSEEQLAAEQRFRKTRGQLNLFETEETGEWKSTQSVSPKKAPPNSSTPCEGLEFGD